MGKTNSEIISIMFEEIKEKLQTIESKIPLKGNTESSCKFNKQDVESSFKDTNKREFSLLNENIQNSTNKLIHIIKGLNIQEDKPQVLSESKTLNSTKQSRFSTPIILILGIFISIIINIYLYSQVNKLHYNDLKYRYIQVCNGIENKKLNQLEDFFQTASSEKINKFEDDIADRERKK